MIPLIGRGRVDKNKRGLQLVQGYDYCLEHVRPVVDRPLWFIRQAVGVQKAPELIAKPCREGGREDRWVEA